MAETAPPLLVVIVNYRTPPLTVQCLRSVAAEVPSLPGMRVVVVDNGSGDDSVTQLRAVIAQEKWSGWATVLALDTNCGFAAGNNRGFEVARDARYVLLLNSDTVVSPGCLRDAYEKMDSEPGIGALSCLVLNDDGSAQNVARPLPTPLSAVAEALGLPWRFPKRFGWANPDDLSWDRMTSARDVGWLGGAFLFVRGDLVRSIGLLDEDFFFYGEDVEFGYRVWKSGHRCHYDGTLRSIVHIGNASSDETRMDPVRRRYLQSRSRYLVLRKCCGTGIAILIRALDLGRAVGRVALRGVRSGWNSDTHRAALQDLRVLVRLP